MWLWRVMCVLVLFCAELHLFVLPIYPVVFPLFCSYQSSAGAICQTAYRWRPGLFSCWTHHMEEPAGQCHLCSISVNLPSASENISVLGFLSWHYHWWPVAYSPILSGFWSDLFTWTTVKIHNWLLDWLIDWLYHVISMSGSSGRRCNWKSQGSRQWLPWRWYVCL